MNYSASGFPCPKCESDKPKPAIDDGVGRRIYILTCACGHTYAVEMAHGGGFIDKSGRVVEL